MVRFGAPDASLTGSAGVLAVGELMDRLHLPPGHPENNTVWMWAAVLAGNLPTLLQALTGIDTGEQGRAHVDRLRHQLLRVPARALRHARGLTLRLPPATPCYPRS
ncbi:hypothetical protein RHODO2019_06530 [Rhodococcus antarcticus]|uniref:Uncharacterized protein n=1 Tax=Rhodococcus antarcticus TaxID=2987751 RepID=A0ABY6P492_9NOCA|nr:hypothetical protein [Rhodococcus antarcticus]UZJ26081.1 hypothetical protein RHODO2019_06530 [Rhodococcus antarcticus]